MEIRPVSYSAPNAAAPTEKADTRQHLPGNAVKPVTESALRQPSRSAETEETKQAVEDIERMTKLFSKSLEFSYDSAENRAIMRVVDQETKEVIRQVPTKEALAIAKALEKIHDMLLVQGAKTPLGK